MKYLIIAFLLFSNVEAEENLDKLSLVSLLVKDGHLDRAKNVLGTVTEKEAKEDYKRFYTLTGLVFLADGNFEKALENFSLSQKFGQKDQELLIYIGQAYYGLKDYENVIKTLINKNTLFMQRPKLNILFANSYWNLGKQKEAFDVINKAIKDFPFENEFKKQFLSYLIELGLYQVALEEILSKANDGVWSAFELQGFASGYISKNRLEEAKRILTAALLLNPKHENITHDLAGLMARNKQYYSAAIIFDQSLEKNPKFADEASELYRLSGHPIRALQLNTLVQDGKERLKQRLALYLENHDYEKAVTLENGLTLTGLLEAEEIRYALAYAYYKTGSFSKTEQHLNLITEERLFNKAIGLRASIEKCQENIWSCE